MPHTQADSIGVDAGVTFDHASLRGQPAGGDTRYTVAVRGVADEAWAEAYLSIQETSVVHRRFRLDRRTRTISFSCPSVEGPAYVFEMLERLEELLEVADRGAAFRRAQTVPAQPPIRPIA